MIMSSALDDLDAILGYAVHDAVLVVDAATPKSAEIPVQGLRLADPTVSVPFNILQELIDSLQGLFVLGLPVQVIRPSIFCEQKFTHPPCPQDLPGCALSPALPEAVPRCAAERTR